MKKHWLKNECFKLVVLGIVFACVMSFALFLPAVNDKVDAYNTMSIYSNSEVDFVIPSPGKQQVSELVSLEHIESVTPYYYTKTSVDVAGSKLSSIGVIMFEPEADLDKTAYTKARLTEEIAVDKPTVYVDYSFAKSNNVKCGDSINLTMAGKSFGYVIGGIYENNVLLEETALVVRYTEELESQINAGRAKALSYSGAYVTSSAVESSESYFNNQYKPMGLLKAREEFTTDEAYEIHKKGFYEADYSKNITTLSVGEAAAKIDAKKMNTSALALNISMVVFSVVFCFGVGAIFFKQDKKFYVSSSRKGVKTKQLVKYQLASSGTQSIIAITLSALCGVLVCSLNKSYLALATISLSVWIFAVSIVATSVAALITFALLAKKTCEKNYKN